MISSLGNSGLNLFMQTANGLFMGSRSNMNSIAKLVSLSSPSAAFNTPSNSGADTVINQLANEKKSADSAQALLEEVYQRVKSSLSGTGDAEQTLESWKSTLSDLKVTQTELAELQSQAQSSASGRSIYLTLQSSVDAAVSGLEGAISLGAERGLSRLQQSERAVLSGLSKVSHMVDDLGQASLNAFQVQSAYGATPFGAQQGFVFHEAQDVANQRTGLVLDLVS